jgi:hypothetical protein
MSGTSLSNELLDLRSEEDGSLLGGISINHNPPADLGALKTDNRKPAVHSGTYRTQITADKASADFSWEDDDAGTQEDGEAVLKSLVVPPLQPMAFGGPLSASSSRKVLGLAAQHSNGAGQPGDADSASEISSPQELEYSDEFSAAASAPPSPVLMPPHQGFIGVHIPASFKGMDKGGGSMTATPMPVSKIASTRLLGHLPPLQVRP